AWLGGSPAREIPRYSRWFLIWAGFDRAIERHFRCLGDRRATVISLAAQLYRADHDGRWPARLDELVPAYLPAVPIDPFTQGRPFGYILYKDKRPLTYFEAGGDAVEDPPDKATYDFY